MKHRIEDGPEGLVIAKKEIVKLPYRARNHPQNTSPAQLMEQPEIGANCQLTAAAISLARGFDLGTQLQIRSTGLLDPQNPRVLEVPDVNQAETGDIILLYAPKKDKRGKDGKYAHVGIVYKDPDEEIHVTDTSKETGGLSTRRLSQMLELHEGIARIVRPLTQNESSRNPEFLQRIGAQHLIVEF